MAITVPTIGSSGWGTVLNTALNSLQSQILANGVVLPAGTSLAAIQAAGDALEGDGGGYIQLSPGEYTVNGTINLWDKVVVRGSGPSTIITQSSTTLPLFKADGKVWFGLSDMYLNGPGSGSGTAIQLLKGARDDVPHYYIRDITGGDFGGDGIEVENSIVADIVNVQFNLCGGYAFNIHGQPGGAAGTSTNLIACFGNACTTGAFYIEKMTYSNLIGCATDDNAVNYSLKDCEGLTLQSCGAENATGDIFHVDGGENTLIIGGWTYLQQTGVDFLQATGTAYVGMFGCTSNSPAGGNYINCGASAHVGHLLSRAGGRPNAGTTGNITTTGVYV